MSVFARAGLGLVLLTVPLSSANASPVDADGQKVMVKVQAIGDQIYECKADATGAKTWQFREPLATLTEDGKTVGRHFTGPEWLFDDGSFVVGKVAAKSDGATPQDIPWLRLDVVNHGGQGRLSGVTTVQRLATQGGVFAGACEKVGELHLEPYRATYIFLGQ